MIACRCPWHLHRDKMPGAARNHARFHDLFWSDPATWGPRLCRMAGVEPPTRWPRPRVVKRLAPRSPRVELGRSSFDPPPGPDSRVVFRTFVNSFSGFGRFTMHLGKALEAAGTPVAYEASAEDERYAPVDPWQRARVVRDAPEGWRLSLQYLGQDHLGDRPTVAYTMHETSRITPAHAQVLNRAEAVVVPSRWNADAFRASGVERPIHVVPLGYDPGEGWSPAREPDGKFRTVVVGMTAAGGSRKRIGHAITAWRAAFEGVRDAELVVKVWPSCLQDLPALPMDGRIRVLAQAMPVGELVRLVQSADLYLTATAGEGWGLPCLEAMACGVAPVATLATSHAEFMDKRCAWVVPHGVEPAGPPYEGMGEWFPPSIRDLERVLRAANRRRDRTAELGRRAALKAQRFTWAESGRKLQHALRSVGMLAGTEPPLPSISRMVGGAVRTAAAVVASGGEIATPEVQASRRAACLGCIEHYRPSDQRCGAETGCGCVLSKKIPLAASTCPVGRW